jgi:protein tyrosine phosphatase (PTP) superfamily phosphohydrolase (DUF442 family)
MLFLLALWAAPPQWAQPVQVEGLPNLHRVTPNYWRGAQPTMSGMHELERMGVKTVVSLRAFSTDEPLLRGTKLRYEHIRFKAWHPEREDVVRFLRIVTDPKNQPVFVHCEHGADRTGMMTAIYRVAFQGWTKEQAVDEMQHGGFGFHSTWQNLVRFVRELDIGTLKKTVAGG